MSQTEENLDLREELVHLQAEVEKRQNLLNQWMEEVHTAEQKVAAAEAERDSVRRQMSELHQRASGFEEQLSGLQQENRRLAELLQATALERDQALVRAGGLEEQISIRDGRIAALEEEIRTRLTTRIWRKIRGTGK